MYWKAKRSNAVTDWERFRSVRNNYNTKIKEAKENSEKSQAHRLKDRESLSSKKWWRLAKSFLKKEGNSTYPPLKIDDDLVCEDKAKAEAFNDFFLQSSTVDDSQAPVPDNTCHADRTLGEINLTPKDIEDLLKTLDITKASGPDQISQVMIKRAGEAIVPSLTRLFNLSLSKGIFPFSWKRANVIPIHKKNDNAIVDNYRPVSLLSCVGKLFERVVFKYVFNFLRDTGAISLRQSGFMPGDSTVYQLAHLYHIFSEAIDKQKTVRVVFCDISKAFDRVWHVGLLAKLSRVGITGTLLRWFENYLSNRQQRVVINGQESPWGTIKAGVPQGSVLGPLLFLIYINDLTNQVQSSEVRLFADDTILYVIVDNPAGNPAALKDDLDRIKHWAAEWIVNFSPPKTKTMTLAKKKLPHAVPPINFGDTQIDEVQSHKHLGLILSHDLSWKEHIESMVASAGKCLDVLNALKFKLDRKTLEHLYVAFIRSKLEYGNIVWDSCTKEQSDMIEQVQYRAGKIISGAISRTSHELVYKELSWEKLVDRRKAQRLKVMYKMVNSDAPLYLQEMIHEDEPTGYNLRNTGRIAPIRGRTVFYENTFIPRTVKDWNSLPREIQRVETCETFSVKIKSEMTTPIWYYTGERSLSIFHARLRMLCSPLNDHLFSFIHVVDSPECACGHVRENNKHFLLDCPLFVNERVTMFAHLERIRFRTTVINLLYGNTQYSDETNCEAFTIIQKYISDTGRFQ